MTKRLIILIALFVIGPSVGAASAQAPGVAPGGPPGAGRGGFAPVVIGPPAPVPSEVAIPRPTPAELEQVNAALKRFIDSDKSSAQPLLKKFESLMLLQKPRLNVAATFTQTNQRMGPRHEGFVATAKQGNIDLLLIVVRHQPGVLRERLWLGRRYGRDHLRRPARRRVV